MGTDRRLLMIPGPIEFDPDVLNAMSRKTDSHVSPDFIALFGGCLRRLRDVFRAPDGQPFVVAGSGTTAMEMAAANVVEPGDAVLVVSTGYFGERNARLLARHGAEVEVVEAPPGDVPPLDTVEAALKRRAFKAMFVTHVDTSTGVRADAEALAKLARAHGVLSVFDGVCATAGEVFEQTAWDADIYLTASQKALGVPPGLAIVMARPRALEAWRQRTHPVRSYAVDWEEWLPIMEAYEEGRPSYFATPPVNLIYALDVSLRYILEEGMEAVWARHARVARAFQAAWRALGLRMLPVRPEIAAHTLSAVYYPEGVDASVLARIAEEGVIVAGGLHPQLKAQYFRVGHMGRVRPADVLATVGAIERAFRAAGADVPLGAGVQAAQIALAEELQ